MKSMQRELSDMINDAKVNRVKAIRFGGTERITSEEIKEAEEALNSGNEKKMHIAIQILKG